MKLEKFDSNNWQSLCNNIEKINEEAKNGNVFINEGRTKDTKITKIQSQILNSGLKITYYKNDDSIKTLVLGNPSKAGVDQVGDPENKEMNDRYWIWSDKDLNDINLIFKGIKVSYE